MAKVRDTKRRKASLVAMPRAPPSCLLSAVRRAAAMPVAMSGGTSALANWDAASASNSMASASCSNSLKCSALMPDRPAAPSLCFPERRCHCSNCQPQRPCQGFRARPCGQGVPEGRMPLATGLPAGCWGGRAIRPRSIGVVLDAVSSTVTVAATPATGQSCEHGSGGAEKNGPCPVCSGPCPQILCNYAAPAPARPPRAHALRVLSQGCRPPRRRHSHIRLKDASRF